MTADAARRMAVWGAGLAEGRPSGRVDVRHFRRVMRSLDLVQLDSVNVSARTHYWVFFSRLGQHSMDALDDWLWRSGEHFEYWAHERSILPLDRFPLMGHRMRDRRPRGRIAELLAEQPEYVAGVLEEVAERGPLAASHLEEPGDRTGPWWGYGKGKIALEWHFAKGAVTVADRPGFHRLYDLTERVVPTELIDLGVPADEARVELMERSALALGVGTIGDIADYYRIRIGEARRLLPELLGRGAVREVEVAGWGELAYRHVDAVIPRAVSGATVVSPFDPLVWNRDRAERVFGFRYRIEIYVPAEQRVHGYYVLPFLLDGELVGRVDLKNDRDGRRLVVRTAHLESGRDPALVASALATHLEEVAGWLGCGSIVVEREGDLAEGLARVLE